MNISILTVTKNRSKYLQLCLQSLAEQTEKPTEVVVIDNASTDDTKKLVADFFTKLPIVYKYSKVQGYPRVYNAGLHTVTGDWIIFLDDDCIASKDWLQQYIRAIKKHPGAAVQGKTISIPKGNIYVDIMGDHYQNWIEANTIALNRLKTFDNKNLCVSRSELKKIGLFNETLTTGSEDIELGFRFDRAGIPIIYDPSIVAYHKERDTFLGFMRQHIRIARSESIVDQMIPAIEKIGVLHKRKIALHIQSFFRRELLYFRNGQVVNLLKLPFLYGALAIIRIWTYHMTTWSTKK